MNPNPFKPTACKRPNTHRSRESVIEVSGKGLDNGAGRQELMLITGNRGCGKTVLLRELQRPSQ